MFVCNTNAPIYNFLFDVIYRGLFILYCYNYINIKYKTQGKPKQMQLFIPTWVMQPGLSSQRFSYRFLQLHYMPAPLDLPLWTPWRQDESTTSTGLHMQWW